MPRDKAAALGDVLDRWRLNQGWNPWDNATQMAAIASWVHILDREGVPAAAYCELYERAIGTRARAIQQGKSLPAFGAEVLLAEWSGENGLAKELRQREIDAGRTLGANAASVCRWCGGSGFKPQGNGVTRCDHGE